MYPYKLFLRADYKKKNGAFPIYLRVIINRHKKEYTVNIAIHPEHWDYTRCKIKKSCKDHYRLNQVIDSIIHKTENIFHNHSKDDRLLTIEEFDRLYKSNTINSDSFYDFALKVVEDNKHVFAHETKRTYISQVTKLKQFRPELNFSEVNNLSFINSYKSFMISKLNNKLNTYNKSLSFIKSVINKAIIQGVVNYNVFANYKLSKQPGKREFLNINEVKRIYDLYGSRTLESNLQNVLKYFLFGCFTGLRYSDMKNVRFKNIVDSSDREGNKIKMLTIVMHKTKDIVTVPLMNDKAINLITTGFNEQKIFKVITNQKTNEKLKTIMIAAGIGKSISFHCARHTFATYCIEKGIPLEIIQKLLGHKSISTTQIYAKISENRKIDEMKKLNDF